MARRVLANNFIQRIKPQKNQCLRAFDYSESVTMRSDTRSADDLFNLKLSNA
jgi:hypothetical protein